VPECSCSDCLRELIAHNMPSLAGEREADPIRRTLDLDAARRPAEPERRAA